MAKVSVQAGLEYVIGHLDYGHYEGIIEFPDEDIEKFKENPIKYIKDERLTDYLDIVIDEFEIDDYGNITDIDYLIL